MRNLLLGVILGLFALGQSTPLNAVTQIPAKAEEDDIKDVVTEGFILPSSFLHSAKTESSQRKSRAVPDMLEGSGTDSEESHTTAVLPTVRFTSTTLLGQSEDQNSSSTQSPQSGFTSTSVPSNEEGTTQGAAQSSLAPSHNYVSQNTESPVFTTPRTTPQIIADMSFSTTTSSSSSLSPSTAPDMSFSATSTSSSSLSPNIAFDMSSSTTSTSTSSLSPNIAFDMTSSTTSTSSSSLSPNIAFDMSSSTTTTSSSSLSPNIVPDMSSSTTSTSSSSLSPNIAFDMSSSTTSTSSSSLSPSTAPVTHQDSVTEQHAPSELSTVSSTSTAGLSTSRAGGMLMSTENPVENSAGEETVSQSTTFAPVNRDWNNRDEGRFMESEGSGLGMSTESTVMDYDGETEKTVIQEDVIQPRTSNPVNRDWNSRDEGRFTESEGSGLGMSTESPVMDYGGEPEIIMARGAVVQSQAGHVGVEETILPPPPGHTTPGWIIIVAFVVAVAALVVICVAIATRDKWNGPSQASQERAETQANASSQQMELEMETFLEKDSPTENGQAAEYTIIPLNELPEKDSSP